MTIAEIRQLEGAREDGASCNVVHLLKEGEFYRAHDWSAWLLSRFPMGDAPSNPLKVTAKRMKDGYVDAFVGFPCSSIGKYIPNDGTVDFQPVNDSQIDVILQQVELTDTDEGQIRQQVDEWKESLPMNDKKQHREEREVKGQVQRITRLSDIVARIVSLSLEDITPREAYDILRDLRRQVAAIF